MHNGTENAYKLIICNECIAMCRAFLFCAFPFSQWLPAICSSRSVLGFQSPFQITDTQVWVPSKNCLGEKQQAALLTFTAASQVADTALLPLGTEGEMLGEPDPAWGEGKGGIAYLVPWGGFMGQKAVLLLWKKRRFGDYSFKRRRATLSRCKRIWRVNEISERVRSWLIPLTDGKWFPHSLWGWREVKE